MDTRTPMVTVTPAIHWPIVASELGNIIRATAETLLSIGHRIEPQQALYAEKTGGFQCGTCANSVAVNATHGRCSVVQGTVHMQEGCCAMWLPDTKQLHLYREPQSET